MQRNPSYFLLLCVLLVSSCQKLSNVSEVDSRDLSYVINEIETVVWALHTADTSMNAEGVIDLLWPEASMLIDGNRMSYEEISDGSRQFMKGLTLFHTEWNDLQIIPVTENAAISSFIFIDSIVNNQGSITQAQGPNTFMWIKRKDEWKIIFGDADHYPRNQ